MFEFFVGHALDLFGHEAAQLCSLLLPELVPQYACFGLQHLYGAAQVNDLCCCQFKALGLIIVFTHQAVDYLLFLDEFLGQKVPLLSVLETVRTRFHKLIESSVSSLLGWVVDYIRSGGVRVKVLWVAADLQFDIGVSTTDSLRRPVVIKLDAELLDGVARLVKRFR